MKRFYIVMLVMVLVSLALIAGCGDSGGKVLAVVGDHTIDLDEFKLYTRNMRPNYPDAQAEFESKKDALDSLITTYLLIQAAYEKGIDKNEEVARVVLANRPKFLLDALYKKHVSDLVSVSETEIMDFYAKLEYQMRASQVILKNEDTAQMLFERLKNGADFEQVAFEYSVDPSAKRNRGDIGNFLWDAPMPEEFREAVFSMEAGELSPPVKTSIGYHIIKLVSKTKNMSRQSLEQMRKKIEQQIKRQKSEKLITDYMNGIKTKYPITIEESTCDYVLHKREQLYPPQLLEGLPKSDFDLEQLDRNERELVLATWEGGQMSLHQYLTKVSQFLPIQQRPDLDDYDSLAVVVFAILQPDILSYEAIKEGLESDPGFKENFDRYRELVMGQMMKDDSIPKPPPVQEAEARKYYDKNPSEFSNPAKIHVFEIMLGDELKARKLANEIKSLEEFKELATDLTERPGKRPQAGDLFYIDRNSHPDIFDRAWKTAIGGIGGPVSTLGKYSIFYVVDRVPEELKDFLGVKREVMQKLNHRNKVSAFVNWVEQRRAVTDIEENPELLWETIDRTQYAAGDTSSAVGN